MIRVYLWIARVKFYHLKRKYWKIGKIFAVEGQIPTFKVLEQDFLRSRSIL